MGKRSVTVQAQLMSLSIVNVPVLMPDFKQFVPQSIVRGISDIRGPYTAIGVLRDLGRLSEDCYGRVALAARSSRYGQ
jgi:hypothetical protein